MLRQRGAANPQAIGPMIHYCEPSLSPEEIQREHERLGKTLLVFPTHSTHWRKVDNDIAQFCRSVEAASEGFDSVRFCLYWKDILNGADELYLNKGWELTSAGHMFDPQFCPRLKSLILTSDACMTFEWGTHIGYSVFLNRPVFTSPVEFVWCDSGAAPPPFIDGEIRVKAMELFEQWSMEITPEQRSFVSLHWGFDSVRSPEEMRALLLEAEAAWKDREQ